jgi:hypothetical protein
VINTTRMRGLTAAPYLLSQFQSKAHFLQALLAGTAIPAISLLGVWLRVGRDCCCDGAFTCLAPRLAPTTVLISPFRKFQPCGFDFTIAPTKAKPTTTGSSRAARGPLAAIMQVVRVCFVPPGIEACLVDARRGYDDARAARDMFIAAGWMPRPNTIGRFEWPDP